MADNWLKTFPYKFDASFSIIILDPSVTISCLDTLVKIKGRIYPYD